MHSRLNHRILNGPEDEKHTGMILIDLQKACSILYHKILLDNMKSIVFVDQTMVSVFSEQENFFCFIRKCINPEAGTISWGVPQGFIL